MNSVEFKNSVEDEIKQSIKGCIIRPSVAVIKIGDDEKSDYMIKEREESCNKTGIYFRYYDYEDTTPELTIINKIKELNNDDYVNGVMIQLPIPEKYNEKRLLNSILNSKDVEGQTDINIGRLISGRKTIVPSFTLSVMKILNDNNIEMSNKNIAIIYDKKNNIRPLVNMLINNDATVTVCKYNYSDLNNILKNAEIIISAVNKKNIIKLDMISEGVTIIDAGYDYVDGKMYGDVDYKSVKDKANIISDQKDGIYPLLISMFLKNIIFCYESKK